VTVLIFHAAKVLAVFPDVENVGVEAVTLWQNGNRAVEEFLDTSLYNGESCVDYHFAIEFVLRWVLPTRISYRPYNTQNWPPLAWKR